MLRGLVLIVKMSALSWWNSSAHLTGLIVQRRRITGETKAGGYSFRLSELLKLKQRHQENTASAAASEIQIFRRKRVRTMSRVNCRRAARSPGWAGAGSGTVAPSHLISGKVGAGCGASARKTFGPAIKLDQSVSAGSTRPQKQSPAGRSNGVAATSPARDGRVHFAAASPTSHGSIRRPQLTHIHRLRLQQERRQGLRRNHVAQVSEYGSIPRQIKEITLQIPTSTGFASLQGARRSGQSDQQG